MKGVILFVILFVSTQCQYAYQDQHTKNTDCSGTFIKGTLSVANRCYLSLDGKSYHKYTCDSNKTTSYRGCDSTCQNCSGKIDIKPNCLRVGENSIQFKCGKPDIKPKGYAFATHSKDGCKENSGVRIFFSDSYCLDIPMEGFKNYMGFEHLQLKNTSSILQTWNEEKRSAEYSVFSLSGCKGNKLHSIFFPENKCIRTGQYFIMAFKP